MEAEQNDMEWLLDCMVEYLKGPLWTTEVCNHIDEYCIFFSDEEENCLEYTQYHINFKKLVEEKLDGFCAEFGIEHEHFV